MSSKDIQYFLMKCNKIEKLILHGGKLEYHTINNEKFIENKEILNL